MLGFFSFLLLFADPILDVHQVVLQPIDIQHKGNAYPLHAIHQIESDGQRLFLRSLNETRVLVVDRMGRIQQEIGRDGNGPGEWGATGIQALALFRDELWGFGTHRLTLNGYEGVRLLKSFDAYDIRAGHQGTTSNVFAVSETSIAVASPFGTNHLAVVYAKSGQSHHPVGTRLIEEKDLLEDNPFANDTMWLFDGHRWYALFKFYPVIAIFDKAFEKQTFYNLDHPWIAKAFAFVSDDHGPDIILPLFSDFKMFRNQLFLMCRDGLLQMDPKDMTVLSVTRFLGEGPDFESIAGKPLTLPYFSFLEDGTLVLAHPMLLWNHDLWQVPESELSHLRRDAGF